MKTSEIIKHVREDGGITLDGALVQSVSLDSGYMVSFQRGGSINVPMCDHAAVNAALELAKRELLAIAEYPEIDIDRLYVGAWLDENEYLHIDVSQHIMGLEKALHAGSARMQKAIYSWRDQVAIPVSKSA